MLKYTKIGVNIISIVISIVIFILIDLFIFNQNFAFESNFNSNEIQENDITNIVVQEENTRNNVIQEENYAQVNEENVEITIENPNKTEEKFKEDIKENIQEEQKVKNQQIENSKSVINWQIEIPAISLSAEIRDGTTNEIMNSFVGHFEETSKTEGNVGLAAHNRGYPKNYFQNLKKLKEGDEIIYKYNEFEKTYIVEVHKIIEDVDWTYLEETEENTITLITCVENEPNYRRCVQAVEKIDE